MSDSVPNLSAAPAANLLATAPTTHQLRIQFTGSGSEYFRIWIVNLLLMLVTLGIYFPWAKVRRLRYFHGNTLVDGAPLDFHGSPSKMLKGYLLVGLLFMLYSAAGQFSATAGLIAFLIVMAIAPALLKSSMQFRLANTSWRGMRFSFRGSLPDVYRAVLPLLLPSLVILAALTGVTNPDKPPTWYLATFAVVMLATLAVLPWLFWNLKQYQHNHYALASLQTTFTATVGSFYKLLLKVFGLTLLTLVMAILPMAAMGYLSRSNGSFNPSRMVVLALLPVLGMLIIFVGVKPYVISHLQNLVWTRTGNSSLRFISKLGFKPLLWLTLKNWLLMILTLGLYWPFAAVSLARMRLEAVSVKTRSSPDTLVSEIGAADGDAAGDAAGDLFGLDIGL
ncbi:MAG: YjgN family protein [Rhodoferax sp.]|nr:YjgN family protein [Rhodoferax sp.]